MDGRKGSEMRTRSNRTIWAVTCLVAAILLTVAVHPARLFAARPRTTSKPIAKNVIVMIADGWDYNHIEATSYYRYGLAAQQVYNGFPVHYAM